MKMVVVWFTVLVVLGLVIGLILSLRFSDWIADLRSAAAAEQTSVEAGIAEPPEIMRRFAERNGGRTNGSATVEARQRVQMRLSPGQRFFDMEATLVSGTRRPTFVWEATASIAGVVPMRALDSFVGGQGQLEVRVAGVLPIAHATGPESDKGEIMRFLAELAWNPDAILNASALLWRQIDERTVEVSAPIAGGMAKVRQIFDVNGDILGIEADDRPYFVEGKPQSMRWIGRFRDYKEFGAYRVPSYGEVAWDLPDGEFLYWRGTILSFGSTDEIAP